MDRQPGFLERFVLAIKAEDNVIMDMQQVSARQRDILAEMHELAQEFEDYISKVRSIHDRFHGLLPNDDNRVVHLPQAQELPADEEFAEEEAAEEPFVMPKALKGGPRRGGE